MGALSLLAVPQTQAKLVLSLKNLQPHFPGQKRIKANKFSVRVLQKVRILSNIDTKCKQTLKQALSLVFHRLTYQFFTWFEFSGSASEYQSTCNQHLKCNITMLLTNQTISPLPFLSPCISKRIHSIQPEGTFNCLIQRYSCQS